MHAQAQAFDYGVKVSGATVHLVTPELDAGPIVAQRAVAVAADDTATRCPRGFLMRSTSCIRRLFD